MQYVASLLCHSYSRRVLRTSTRYLLRITRFLFRASNCVPWSPICKIYHLLILTIWRPIPVAAYSKAWVCGCSRVGIVSSNPTGGMDVCLLWVLCVVRWSLRRADHSYRGVLPNVACLNVIVKPRKVRPWPGIGSKRYRGKKKNIWRHIIKLRIPSSDK